MRAHPRMVAADARQLRFRNLDVVLRQRGVSRMRMPVVLDQRGTTALEQAAGDRGGRDEAAHGRDLATVTYAPPVRVRVAQAGVPRISKRSPPCSRTRQPSSNSTVAEELVVTSTRAPGTRRSFSPADAMLKSLLTSTLPEMPTRRATVASPACATEGASTRARVAAAIRFFLISLVSGSVRVRCGASEAIFAAGASAGYWGRPTSEPRKTRVGTGNPL